MKDTILIPRPARQFESVLGSETNGGNMGKTCAWVDERTMWAARIVTTPDSFELDPADGRGAPRVALSGQGIAAQCGADHLGEFNGAFDEDGYVAIARPGGTTVRLPDDPQTTKQERLKRRSLFFLRDPADASPVAMFSVQTQTTLDLYLTSGEAAPRKVHAQPRANPQPAGAWTPRPLSGRGKVDGLQDPFPPYRRLFIFGENDVRGHMQAMAYDVDAGRFEFITDENVDLMAGCAYWHAGRRCVVCVAAQQPGGVSTAIRTYCETREGVRPWQRVEDYAPPMSQLLGWQRPGSAQSPEVSAPLRTGEQLTAWTVHERQGALSGFAIGMYGCVCAAIIGRPETARVIGPLDSHGNVLTNVPVCEPEMVCGKDGKSWWVVYERAEQRVADWGQWNPELRSIGPLTVEDFHA